MIDRYAAFNDRDEPLEPMSDRLSPLGAASLVLRAHHYLMGPQGEAMRGYLSSRGVDADTAKNFMLGLGPPNAPYGYGGNLLLPLLDWDRRRLVQIAGITRKTNGSPKYVHEEGFAKSEHLYGLVQALPAIVRTGETVLVEGPFDVLALHSAGVRNAVGLHGSAISRQQVELLYCAQTVVVMLDGDDAGRKGQAQALGILRQYALPGTRIVGAGLPDGKDPCAFVNEFGRRAVEDIIRKAVAA